MSWSEFSFDSLLFRGLSRQECLSMLSCLDPVVKTYEKGEYILSGGEAIHAACLTMEGNVHLTREDAWGNRHLIGFAGKGELFGESYACLPQIPLTVNAVAAEPCKIAFLDIGRVFHTCSRSCIIHQKLIENFLSVLAGKNLTLMEKIDHISQKTTREKVMAYLSLEAMKQQSNSFAIPFNRQQLADYLCVERSALSAELGKMQREGLIWFQKNRFRIL